MQGRPRRIAVAAALLALLAGTAAGAHPRPARADDTACPDADLEPASGNADRVAAAMNCLLNVERRNAGLAPLVLNAKLSRSSQYQSDDMVDYHYFAHQRPYEAPLLTRIKSTGYFDHVTGGLYSENLAAAPDGRASASAVVSAWMQSDHHRANILFPDFREIGVGATVTGPDPAFYQDYPSVVYATDFGRRYYRGPAPACNRSRSAPGLPHRVCQRRRTHHHRRRHRVSRS